MTSISFSPQAQIIAQAIGQAFAVAYQQFLQANGVKPDEYDDFISTQEQYNGDLVHFSRSENIREVRVWVAYIHLSWRKHLAPLTETPSAVCQLTMAH